MPFADLCAVERFVDVLQTNWARLWVCDAIIARYDELITKVINYNVTTLSSASRTDENVFNSNIFFSFRFVNLLLLSAAAFDNRKGEIFGSKPSRCVTKRNVSSDKDGMRPDARFYTSRRPQVFALTMNPLSSNINYVNLTATGTIELPELIIIFRSPSQLCPIES